MVVPVALVPNSLNMPVKYLKLHRSIPASGSSKIETSGHLAIMVAISILFNSPPDKLLFNSLSIYSFAHNPTLDKILQASFLVTSLFVAIRKMS